MRTIAEGENCIPVGGTMGSAAVQRGSERMWETGDPATTLPCQQSEPANPQQCA